MIKNPDIQLGRAFGGKTIFNILERENSILGVMGQMIMYTNPNTYIYSSNGETRRRICQYLRISPNTYDRILKIFLDRQIIRRVARGSYMFNKSLINLDYGTYNYGESSNN